MAVQVPSPSGREKLVFPGGWGESETDEYTFYAVTKGRQYPIKLDGFVQPYVVWAQDSSGALFFYSDGGANCCYSTLLISFPGGHVEVTNPTLQVAEDFVAYRDSLGISCEVPHEEPNIYAVGWVNRSHALLAAETVCHSICDCYGSFRVYEIELPSGKIVKAFGEALAKKIFAGYLPWDLADAPNDDWDSNPKSCIRKQSKK
ncbi:MAG: hypothetical protein ACHQZS_00280 [Candidatus Binatales bacterium]